MDEPGRTKRVPRRSEARSANAAKPSQAHERVPEPRVFTPNEFEVFLAASPGHEAALLAEVREHAFRSARPVAGGVTFLGGWPEVWRANLVVRGAGRVIARVAEFRAMHLAQLDKRARRIEWAKVLRADLPFSVEASCKSSRIYHSGAAAERIETAIRETLGARSSAEADVVVRARIEDDLCTLGVDTSGELLHKRGHKEAVAKAPMRETMAAMFLRQCGYTGAEPVLDPMCGSGTFVIEAAEIAAGLHPGRTRHFAFEQLATFDAAAWNAMRDAAAAARKSIADGVCFYGSDRDAGAVASARANAARAGVTALTEFRQATVSELVRPAGPPGLVIVNPPYGTRIGDRNALQPLYRSLGQTLAAKFSGWRVGLITTEKTLARATGLPFSTPFAPVPHGGLRVTVFLTPPLA